MANLIEIWIWNSNTWIYFLYNYVIILNIFLSFPAFWGSFKEKFVFKSTKYQISDSDHTLLKQLCYDTCKYVDQTFNIILPKWIIPGTIQDWVSYWGVQRVRNSNLYKEIYPKTKLKFKEAFLQGWAFLQGAFISGSLFAGSLYFREPFSWEAFL